MTFTSLVAPEYFNALQYGNTLNDATLQAAINAMPTSGGYLFVPHAANWTINTPLAIPTTFNSFGMIGEGEGTTLQLANGVNDYMVKFSGTGGIAMPYFANLKFDCNSAGQTAASGGIYAYKFRRSIIENCHFHNPWQTGIYLIGDVGDFGFQNRLVDCWFEGGSNVTSGTNAWGQGLHIENVDENCSIVGCHFENNGNFNDATFGCHIYDKNGLTSYIGNSFVNGAFVMKFDGLQNRVIGNVFDGNGGASVQCNGSASGTIIEGNHFLNVGFRASGGGTNNINCIYLNAPQCQVIGNWFQSAGNVPPETNSFVNIDTGATDFVVGPNVYNIPTGSGTVTPIIFVSGRPARGRLYQGSGFNAVSSAASFVIENHGTSSITTGNTTVVVNHGLSLTPTLEQISVTPQTTLGSAAFWWIDTVTSTQFTIHLNVNPAGTVTFGWRAQVGF